MRYAIGDIHGCLRTFMAMVEEDIALNRGDELYLLGDYIDRGPDPKGVLDYIMDLQQKGYQVFPLMGNHEDMLLSATLGDDEFDLWCYNGAGSTLMSFGVSEDDIMTQDYHLAYRVPQPYREYLIRLKYFYSLEDYILVHAGIDFSGERPFLDRHAMLWSRDPYIDREKLGSKKIIHGHNPVSYEEIMWMAENEHSMAINLDGGCVFTWMKGLGNLVVMNLDSKQIHRRKNEE